MALQKDLTFKGVTVTGAYHKIGYISGSKDGIHVDVKCYKDAAEATTPENFLEEFSFVIESGDLVHDDGASDKNYIKQAYEYMKAGVFEDYSGVSHDYTGSTDV